MPKYLRQALTFGVTAAVVLLFTIFVKNTATLFVIGCGSAALAAIFLLMTVIAAVRGRLGKKELSGWLLFVVSDIVLMLEAGGIGSLGYDVSLGEDLTLGAVMLWYSLPLLGGLLLLELIAYRAYKHLTASIVEDVPDEQKKAPPRIEFPARDEPLDK